MERAKCCNDLKGLVEPRNVVRWCLYIFDCVIRQTEQRLVYHPAINVTASNMKTVISQLAT